MERIQRIGVLCFYKLVKNQKEGIDLSLFSLVYFQ